MASADAPDTIDIAIVYPAQLVAQMGQPAMEAQFALGITQTNEAFASSGVGTRVRLVGTRQVAATQSSDLVTNLRALGTPGDGIFDEAQALREETHADLVSLWLSGSVPGGASCGIAYLGGTDPQYDPQYAAWSVVYAAACATEFRAFAHEVGHNLSAHHDAGASQPPTDGKPYARGYVDVAAQTITVMAYYDQCVRQQVNCTRIGYFSNPNVTYNGRVQGTAATNNVLAINEQMAAVAGYRQSQIYPGTASIAGRPRFKGTAEATSTPWSPAVNLGYQWLLDGVAVPGATASTFKLGRRDIGKTLTLQVFGSAPFYPTVAAPAVSVVVGKALFRTKRPKLRGVPRAGRVLLGQGEGLEAQAGQEERQGALPVAEEREEDQGRQEGDLPRPRQGPRQEDLGPGDGQEEGLREGAEELQEGQDPPLTTRRRAGHRVGSQSTRPASTAYPTNAPTSSSVWATTNGITRPQRRKSQPNSSPIARLPTKPPSPW